MFRRFVFFIYLGYFMGDIVFVSTGNVNLHEHILIDSNLESLKRLTRQTRKCGTREFRCKSGECINEDNQCDGADHCLDGTDETAESCRSVPCPSYLFRCAYGACINGDNECDGKKDCKDNSDETSPRCKNQPIVKPANNCGTNFFQCNSGECIDDLDLCDGIKTCKDGSDESVEVCSNVDCPGFTFRCSYGGCVSKEARCNGQVECIDGSDEKGCKNIVSPINVTPSPPILKPTPIEPPVIDDANSCPMPDQPNAGSYHIGGSGTTLTPGDVAPVGTTLTYRCRPGFKISKGDLNTTYCFNGNWIPKIPQCMQVCPPFSGPKLQVICTGDDGGRIDCEYATSGTTAKVQCAPNYEDLQINENPYRFCRDGSWDTNPPNCIPVCGEKKTNAQELTIGGKVTVVGEYPWQIAVYHNRKNICGGTIITTKLIISAAHCFKYPKTQYEIAAGKHYNDYNNDLDTEAQFSTLEEVFIPSDYRGAEQNHQFDIAVLVLRDPVQFSYRVQPICVDWSNRYERDQLFDNNLGVVTGWGYTEVGSTPAAELKKLQVPYISNSECKKAINPDNYKFLTFDKFCAGYLNGSSVCQGDSGGGLVFRLNERRRYYLRGVVSIGPKSAGNTCDPHQYTFYTLVSKHMDYIVQQRSRYRDNY